MAGVCGGLADYLKMDAIIIRVAFVALTALGGAGSPIYLAMWLIVPKQASRPSRSSMAGLLRLGGIER